MSVRTGEAGFQNYFRCERLFQINGEWHFTTREQTVEGPYVSKTAAEDGLKRYIQLLNCNVFNSEERSTINGMKVTR